MKQQLLDQVSRAGSILLAVLIVALFVLKVGLYNGLPSNTISWFLISLALGYLLYGIWHNRTVTFAFALICFITGLYLLEYYGQPLFGTLLIACSLLIIVAQEYSELPK